MHMFYDKFRSHVGGVQASSYIRQPMTPRYFEISNVSCQVLSDTSLFICKIRVHAISMACSCWMHTACGHHSIWLEPYGHFTFMSGLQHGYKCKVSKIVNPLWFSKSSCHKIFPSNFKVHTHQQTRRRQPPFSVVQSCHFFFHGFLPLRMRKCVFHITRNIDLFDDNKRTCKMLNMLEWNKRINSMLTRCTYIFSKVRLDHQDQILFKSVTEDASATISPIEFRFNS